MSQTLAEMAAEASRLGGWASSTDMLQVLKDGINRRYQRILQKQSWPDVNRTLSVTVAAGETSVGVPIKGALVRSVFNMTLGCRVEHMTPEGMEMVSGDQIGTSGPLRYYTNEGARGVFRNFTSSDLGLFIVSTEAADVGTVTVHGFNNPDGSLYGQPFTATASINGVTPVSVYDPGTLEGVTVEKFSKDSDTVGVILLQGNSGADEAGALAPKERSAHYNWLAFDSAADTATTLRVNCRLHASGMVDDGDVPLLPGVEHILIEGARADGLRRYQQDGKAAQQENLFEGLLNDYLNMRTEDSSGIQVSAYNYREAEY